MRDSGTIRDQIWIVPYDMNDMISLSIPSTLSFPINKVDNNGQYIVLLDNSSTLWALKNIDSNDIEIRRVTKNKVKNYKVYNDQVIIYQENNEVGYVSLTGEPKVPKPLKQGLSISVEQIACGKAH